MCLFLSPIAQLVPDLYCISRQSFLRVVVSCNEVKVLMSAASGVPDLNILSLKICKCSSQNTLPVSY